MNPCDICCAECALSEMIALEGGQLICFSCYDEMKTIEQEPGYTIKDDYEEDGVSRDANGSINAANPTTQPPNHLIRKLLNPLS